MRKWLVTTWSNLFSISWQILILYRLIRFLRRWNGLKFLIVILTYVQQVLSGCHIHFTANIGKDCRLPHPVGIVIGHNVEIGDRVTIFQHVTLGSHGRRGEEMGYPVIEDDVIIYANSVIIGALRIGKGATIGANSLVLRDVPAHGLVYGNPARLHGFICACGDKFIANSQPADMLEVMNLICTNCDRAYTVSREVFNLIAENV